MSNQDKYLNYTEEDFAHDPYFLSFILRPDAHNVRYWSGWLEKNPDKEPLLQSARWRILQIKVDEEAIVQDKLDTIWKNIQFKKATLPKMEDTANSFDYAVAKAKVFPSLLVKALLVAAFCAGIVYLLFVPSDPLKVISTSFGEIKKVTLPDQTEVVLNGNSVLSFATAWSNDEDREVSLNGEAFFDVSHTSNDRKFTVRLTDGIRVNVTGTQFTVTRRPTKTLVVLSKGKIDLIREEKRFYGLRHAITHKQVMQPGDLVEVHENAPLFTKTTVAQPESYAAFAENKIVFKNALLSEVARVLEDTYGYHVTIRNPALANKRFNGTTPTDDIMMLLSAIEKLFGVQVLKKEQQVIIQ